VTAEGTIHTSVTKSYSGNYVQCGSPGRWVDNIKRDGRDIGWDGMDLIGLAQEREQWRARVNTVMNLRVP
jgi:hypothetical protein